jgi:hypothetical protein
MPEELEIVIPGNIVRIIEAVMEHWALRKLEALRFLRKYAAGPVPAASSQEITNMLNRLATPGLKYWQKAACLEWLDIVKPNWRKEMDKHVLAPLVGRDDPEVRVWRDAVLSRDKFKCRSCGTRDHLQAHHIFPWKKYPELRLSVGNGKTLCFQCHVCEHRKMRRDAARARYR